MRFWPLLALAALACGAPDKKKDDEAAKEAGDPASPAAPEGSPQPAPAAAPAPGPTPTPAGYAWPNAAELLYEGTGPKVIDATPALAKGAVAFRVLAEGDSNLIVTLFTDPKSIIVNEILDKDDPPYAAEHVAHIGTAGAFPLEVKADGDWKLRTFVPELAAAVPATLSGSGPELSAVFPLAGKKSLKFAAKHAGKSNFVVKLVDATTGMFADLVVNEIGAYNAEAVGQAYDDGHYLIAVDADGAWELVITPL